MVLLAYALQASGLYVFTRVAWFIFKRLAFKNPFHNIPGPDHESFLLGHLPRLFSKVNGLAYHASIVAKHGPVLSIDIPLGGKALLVSDPKVLHHIFVKDQDVFEETTTFLAMNKIVFGKTLLSTLGEEHRKQRKSLNPVFSINHMRQMVPTFTALSNKLADTMSRIVADGPKEFDVLKWFTRVALEFIGQSGYGYSFDPLTEDYEEHPYITSVKLMNAVLMKTIWVRLWIVPFIDKWNPGGKRFQRFFADHFFTGSLGKLREITNIMHHTSIEIFESKKRALEQGDEAVVKQIGQGKDILSILMRANMEASDEDKLPDDEVLSQISTFTFAAMDTTSSALTRFFYLLSKHQDVQDRLRAEIQDARAKYGDDLNYDQLVGLPYLDAICRETLRLYPPVPLLSRDVVKDVVVPLSKPCQGNNGEVVTEIFFPKGCKVFISISGCNRNPALWGPDANEWRPERWLAPLPDSVIEARVPGVYSNIMTFIGGSRACIGFKFSQLEMKAVLFALLERLRFRVSDKPITWSMTGIVTPSVDTGSLRPELPLVIERV